MRRFFSEALVPPVKQQLEGYFLVAESGLGRLNDLLSSRVVPRGLEVERLSKSYVKDYEAGLHWHNQPHCLIFKADARSAKPVDGLCEVYTLPENQIIKPHLLHVNRGAVTKRFAQDELESSAIIKLSP